MAPLNKKAAGCLRQEAHVFDHCARSFEKRRLNTINVNTANKARPQVIINASAVIRAPKIPVAPKSIATK
jgi:hypothetical protein